MNRIKKKTLNYLHTICFLFFPFRDENELKLGDPPSYANKLSQPGAIDIVNENKASIEPYAE